MNYLVDTDSIIDYLFGKPFATSLLHSLESDGLAMSEVTFGEIYEGIIHGRNPAHSESVFVAFLSRVTILPLSQEIWKRFAYLRGDLRRQGLLIPEFDLLIAATALQHNLTFVMRNLKHYQRIQNLRIHTVSTS